LLSEIRTRDIRQSVVETPLDHDKCSCHIFHTCSWCWGHAACTASTVSATRSQKYRVYSTINVDHTHEVYHKIKTNISRSMV